MLPPLPDPKRSDSTATLGAAPGALLVSRHSSVASESHHDRARSTGGGGVLGVAFAVDPDCTVVSSRLSSIRRALSGQGARLVPILSPGVQYLVSNRKRPLSQHNAVEPIARTIASARKRSAQLALKASTGGGAHVDPVQRIDHIERARHLGVAVITVDALLRRVKSRQPTTTSLEKPRRASTRELPSYTRNKVGLQDLQEEHLPIWKELVDGPPRLHSDSFPPDCPFVSRRCRSLASALELDRPRKKAKKTTTTTTRAGYCESCKVMVADVDLHCASDAHRAAVCDDASRWAQLDKLIEQLGAVPVLERLRDLDRAVVPSVLEDRQIS
ncbi:unnamed protein product (mitochondrion) [Plasmodiophora brassicae]|uniref:DBF4-type domain-containing protein n=1 Tax=Plasmodiophora brassicae TaxID=37360 RepID=A0A3P3YLA4_PLABS|nr:unnamed protein product [Plasmodiophora brassicae]